jgi:hypothetical protein
MNTDAGWKLNTRKPSAAPQTIAARMPAVLRPRSKAMTENAAAAIVDDVHQQHEREHRGRPAGVAELDAVQEREGERVDLNARGDEHDRRGDLPDQLDRRMQVVDVVQRADDRDQRGRCKDPFSPLVVGKEEQARDERAAEDRQAAEQRRVPLRQADLLEFVDRADPPREARRDGREHRCHGERDQRCEDGLGDHGWRRRIAGPADTST